MLFQIMRKNDVCVLVKVSSKGRREGEKERKRSDAMWKSFQRERRIRAARAPRRFDPSNQEICAELVKRSEPMDTSEPLESPRVTHRFLTTIDRIIVRLFRKFKSMEPPFGRILIMELPSGNILRASSKMMPTSCKKRAGEKTST